jgi:hypothetical protein
MSADLPVHDVADPGLAATGEARSEALTPEQEQRPASSDLGT